MEDDRGMARWRSTWNMLERARCGLKRITHGDEIDGVPATGGGARDKVGLRRCWSVIGSPPPAPRTVSGVRACSDRAALAGRFLGEVQRASGGLEVSLPRVGARSDAAISPGRTQRHPRDKADSVCAASRGCPHAGPSSVPVALVAPRSGSPAGSSSNAYCPGRQPRLHGPVHVGTSSGRLHGIPRGTCSRRKPSA